MRNHLGCLLLLFTITFSVGIFAQCPANVQIKQSPENPVCKGTTVTFTVDTITAGSISNYMWVVNGDTVTSLSSVSTSTDWSQVYLIAVSDTCGLDTIVSNTLQIINVELSANYNVIITECNQPVADIEILEITGGEAPYTWDLVTTEGSIGQQDLYKDIPVSSYPLLITDANGCTDTSWINMTVLECPPPNPTEIITPNDDGYNDTWVIRNIDFYPNNEVFIYDRWGQRVYHKKGYTNADGWDVKYIGTDMPVSTYYYIVKVKFEKQDELYFNGPISVFR